MPVVDLADIGGRRSEDARLMSHALKLAVELDDVLVDATRVSEIKW